MGRSVSTPSGATLVAYDYVNIDFDETDWEFLEEDALYRMQSIAPSMSKDDGWLGREDRVLASNCFGKFGLSAYCGLVAYWIVPNDEYPLAAPWVDRIAPKFHKEFTVLVRDGVMSNGEGVYRRV